MANKHWVRVQNTLRDLAARAADHVQQEDLADELRDRGLEGPLFADVIDSPNCDLGLDPADFQNEKITRKDVDEAIDTAVSAMFDGLIDHISCSRCSQDASVLYYSPKFRNTKEYRAYAQAVRQYAKTEQAKYDKSYD